jgi:hypothetical protein
VIDRVSTFADKEIVKFLKSQAVPVAIDQWYQRRQQDSEGDFYRRIASQGPRHDFERGTTQGLYMASADGTFLGYTNHRSPEKVKKMLRQAMLQFRPAPTEKLSVKREDPKYQLSPPNGGLVVRVQAKVMGGYEPTENAVQQIFQTALSRDNLWVSQAEHSHIAAGRFPKSLAHRIARFHLIDNTRGEPPMWRDREVLKSNFKIDGTVVRGHAELSTVSGDRSYSVDLLGELQTEDGNVVAWNMVGSGTYFGDGQYTRGAPQGKFSLAISFTLADGKDIADAIPPQGSRGWLRGYLP